MKKNVLCKTALLITLLSLCFSAFSPQRAAAEADAVSLLDELYENTRLASLEFADDSGALYTVTGCSTLKELIIAAVQGEYRFSFTDLLAWLRETAFGQIKEVIGLIAQLVIIGIVFALIMNSTAEFLNKTIKTAVGFTVFVSLASILAKLFFTAADISSALLTSLNGFAETLLPILSALLISSGGTLTAGVLSPAMLAAAGAMTYLIGKIILPAASLGFVIELADKLNDGIRLSYLSSFIKKTAYFLLGAACTVFGAVTAFEGLVFVSADSAAIKVLKYSAGTLIPIAGKFLSDSADTVAGFLALIKNAVGLAGVIGVLIIAAAPVVKLFLYYLALKVSAVILQPFAEKSIAAAVDGAASYLMFMTVCVLASAALFIIMTGMLLNFGNYLFTAR